MTEKLGITSRPRKALKQQAGCEPVAEMADCIWGCMMRSTSSKSWQEIMPLIFTWNFMSLAWVRFSSVSQSPSRWHPFSQAHKMHHSAWLHLHFLFLCNWSFGISLCAIHVVLLYFLSFAKISLDLNNTNSLYWFRFHRTTDFSQILGFC